MYSLPPPPTFNLTKPPEPILELDQILLITQQLLDIHANKCLQRNNIESKQEKIVINRTESETYQNYLLSIYTIIFFILLFILLIILFIRKIQKLIPKQIKSALKEANEHTYIECEIEKVLNHQRRSIETQQTEITTTTTANNSYNAIVMPYYMTYDVCTESSVSSTLPTTSQLATTISTTSELSFNVDGIWQLDQSTLEYKRPTSYYLSETHGNISYI